MGILLLQKPLTKLKIISKELADQADDLLTNVKGPLYASEGSASLNSEKINLNSKLLHLKTLLQNTVPTIRYDPINVRYKC